MKTSTRVFLVALRLVIGWHFLFEGLSKFETEGWTSEPYLREANGPLAPVFRWMAGDPVETRLTPKPIPDGADMGQITLSDYFPPQLDAEWQAYFNRFVEHYKLTDKQKDQATTAFNNEKAAFMDWLVRAKKEVTWNSPYIGAVKSEKTVAERLKEYHDKQAEVLRIKNVDLWNARNNEVYEKAANEKFKEAQADVNRIRGQLRSDLMTWNKNLREHLYESVAGTLTDEQRQMMLPSPSMQAHPTQWSRLEWLDASVKWSLVVIGIGLLAGLLTRPACLLGALLLLMFYLAQPALPWTPENPKAEGHYLFVNKNIIEMVALLALATTDSGRWLGLDGLLQFLNPWRKKAISNQQPAVSQTKA
jgi:uncharacterized membrane protein YphA (DoxX/SURF4 family)